MSRSHRDSHDLPAGPPPEVLQEIDAAWGRAQAMFESGLELDFEIDPLRRRAFASVVEPGGRRRRISARQAVLAACGDAVLAPRTPVAV